MQSGRHLLMFQNNVLSEYSALKKLIRKKEINKKVGKGSTGSRVGGKHFPPKRRRILIRQHGVTSQAVVFFTLKAVRTSSLIR
jgi:hypothetical protein